MHRLRQLGPAAVVAIVALAAAASGACNSNHNPLNGPAHPSATAENGLSLVPTPAKIIIDPADPGTPTDPNHNDERYGETTLTATAKDPSGAPQAGLDLTFGTEAGTLASGGNPVTTDDNGVATDTLRVYESDPDTIQVSVTDGTRITTATVTKLVAEPPVANAGPDQTVECTGNSQASVTLDGSGSTDPNGDITTYAWYEGYGTSDQVELGTGKILTLPLALGAHTITLVVTDATGKTSTDEVVVTVVDTTPPKVRVTVRPGTLWPPNHQMVSVHATVSVDECGPYTVTLDSVTSSEPDNGLGDGDTANDIQGAAIGTEDYDVDLRAERSGTGPGRTYTLTYLVVDAQGLSTRAHAVVHVPHDQGTRGTPKYY